MTFAVCILQFALPKPARCVRQESFIASPELQESSSCRTAATLCGGINQTRTGWGLDRPGRVLGRTDFLPRAAARIYSSRSCAVMPFMSALNLSRSVRISRTASIVPFSLIVNLQWRADFERRVAQPQVDCVERPNPATFQASVKARRDSGFTIGRILRLRERYVKATWLAVRRAAVHYNEPRGMGIRSDVGSVRSNGNRR